MTPESWSPIDSDVKRQCNCNVRPRLLQSRLGLGRAGAAVLQLSLGIYGGYFGGAVGLLMMATWVLVTSLPERSLAPARTLLLACANAAACVLFAALGLVAWRFALPVAAGGVTGGILGARLGMRLSPVWVRRVTLFCTYAITAIFFIKN